MSWHDNTNPEIFTLDVIGGNGTPFRFVFWPKLGDVVYLDRRIPTQPGEAGYRPYHYDENGQRCGAALDADNFTPDAQHGIRGWHEVDAWDIDRSTRRLVGSWIKLIMEARSWA